MQEVILTNDAKAKILHDYLSQTYVPQLSDHLFKTDQYLQKDAEDFEKIINQGEGLTEELVEKKTIINRTVKQLIDKIQSEQSEKHIKQFYCQKLNPIITVLRKNQKKVKLIKKARKMNQVPSKKPQIPNQVL